MSFAPLPPQTKYRDLFADFLAYHRSAPGDCALAPERLPFTARGLFRAAGYPSMRRGEMGQQGSLFGAGPGWIRWIQYARQWPLLEHWLKGDKCFRPPEAWPDEVSKYLTDTTPEQWCEGMLPDHQPARRGALLYRLWPREGARHLTAYAHGWPLADLNLTDMVQVAALLQQQLPFIIWEHRANLDVLPLPYQGSRTGVATLMARHRCRGALETDPLAASSTVLRNALPDFATPDLIRSLPQRGERKSRRRKLVATDDTPRDDFAFWSLA